MSFRKNKLSDYHAYLDFKALVKNQVVSKKIKSSRINYYSSSFFDAMKANQIAIMYDNLISWRRWS